MARLLIFTLLISTAFVIVLVFLTVINAPTNDILKINNAVTPSPTSVQPGTTTYQYSSKTFQVSSVVIPDSKKIILYPNFTQKLSAQQFKQDLKCKYVINGGFYSPNNTPIGLFATNGEIINDFSPNTLLNGIFSIQLDGETMITKLEVENIKYALQTGPILIIDRTPVNLAIRNDKYARRMVVAKSEQGDVVFLAFYDSENPYLGPMLNDLPDHVSIIDKKKKLKLTDAVNLDGGNASAFIGDGISLTELTPVGSFFCIKN